MKANRILLQKKYARVIECFAKQQGISLDEALGLFYHSEVYQLMRDGVSDMHCMSDAYLAEELKQEYEEKVPKNEKDFGKKVSNEKRISFEKSEDPFYSDSNIQYLENIVRDIKDGKAHFAEHDLIDVD